MDGVGDYTRRLAAELTSLGHVCSLLSLSDHRVTRPTECEFGDAYGSIPGLRLPARTSWPARLQRAMDFREKFSPDWVSWQIVLYGFDPRGLSFGLGRRLREVSGRCRNQIMFHEIWIGEAVDAPLKHKLVGKAQRQIIKDLLKKLRPLVVHTHMPLYRHLLKKLGYPARILPLFGNIPFVPYFLGGWLQQKWPEGGPQALPANRAKTWIFVLFGSIHPEWDADDFRRKATDAAARAGKKCLFISIGRPGGPGERMLRGLRQREGNAWRVLNLGPQPEEDVSQCLLTADFGVSAAPPENVFKSGTAAAMIEHGLPIIVTRPASRYRHCPSEILLEGLGNVARHFDLETLRKTEPRSLLPAVAAQFIADLERAQGA
jgi:glycosyltransferase involved in cell wall biosynthesis